MANFDRKRGQVQPSFDGGFAPQKLMFVRLLDRRNGYSMFFRALLSLMLLPAFLCAGEPPDDQAFYAGYYEDLDWVQWNFEKALDGAFPLESFAVVSFRTWQENGQIPEYSFVIHHQPQFRGFQATVRTSPTDSLLKQLLNLRRDNRQTSIVALAADLQIEEQMVTRRRLRECIEKQRSSELAASVSPPS